MSDANGTEQAPDQVATETTTRPNTVPKMDNDLSAVRPSTPVNENPNEQTRRRSGKQSRKSVHAVHNEQNKVPGTTPNWIDRLKENMNEVDIRVLFSSKKRIVFLLMFLFSLLYIINNPTPSSCNMKIAENRNFAKYYGVTDMKNYFETPKEHECSSSIIFRPALPQMVLKPDHSASSFMTLAKYGTGKTLLRCEYSRSLTSNNYLKVPILNEQVTGYLNQFISEMGVNKTHCQTHNCLINWSENEFAQLLLSTLVTEFINTYDNRKYTDPDLSLDEKINLITIICYYYNDNGTTKLESFINPFLGKSFWSRYEVDQPERKIRELTMYEDKQLLKHLEDDLKRFSILPKGYERLLLLLNILKGEGFQSRALNTHLYGKSFGDLSQFSLFIQKWLKKTPVFIIDGIDGCDFFFEEKKVNSAALESFCRSSVSQAIISIVTTGHFHLSLFYPKVDGVNVQDTMIRKDKFPTHTITWNTKSLINYADYVLQEMNKNAAKTRCTAFPDFKTLVNYSNAKIAKIIDEIPTPRALNFFMMKLMEEMNDDANNVNKPFEATFENVDNAYKKSFEYFDKMHTAEAVGNVGGS